MNEMDTQRIRQNREELADRIARVIDIDGSVDVMDGLRCNRGSQPTARVHGVSRPSLCVIAQGAKDVYLRENRYRYDAGHYLLATVELPITGQVVEASPEVPYLSLRIDLEPAVVGSVMVEAGVPAPRSPADARAVTVSALDVDLLDAVLRLVRLVDKPAEARVLAPLVKREIVFRLLMGEQGQRLRHLPMLGGNSHVIAQAIERLRKDFARPLRIDSIARDLGMSSSGFHHHFKAITDMSPLQYQKQLRLQEARRLMFGDHLDAAGAGFKVGYEDPSHFSRDYKRQFGLSPIKDVEQLRQSAIAAAEV